MEAISYIVAAVLLFATGYSVRAIRNVLIISSILSDLGEIVNAQSSINEATGAYINGMLDILDELHDRRL